MMTFIDTMLGLDMCYYSGVYLWYQALDDIKKEYELTKQIHDLLNGFKANPVKEARKYKMEDKPSQPAPTRDPDVWPPPTPVESRFVLNKGKTSHRSSITCIYWLAVCYLHVYIHVPFLTYRSWCVYESCSTGSTEHQPLNSLPLTYF